MSHHRRSWCVQVHNDLTGEETTLSVLAESEEDAKINAVVVAFRQCHWRVSTALAAWTADQEMNGERRAS